MKRNDYFLRVPLPITEFQGKRCCKQDMEHYEHVRGGQQGICIYGRGVELGFAMGQHLIVKITSVLLFEITIA